jgi:hypothetical protein
VSQDLSKRSVRLAGRHNRGVSLLNPSQSLRGAAQKVAD